MIQVPILLVALAASQVSAYQACGTGLWSSCDPNKAPDDTKLSHFYTGADCSGDKGYAWDTKDARCHYDKPELSFRATEIETRVPSHQKVCMVTYTNPGDAKTPNGKTCLESNRDRKIIDSVPVVKDQCIATPSKRKDVVFDFVNIPKTDKCHNFQSANWVRPRDSPVQFYSDDACQGEDYHNNKDVFLDPSPSKCLLDGKRQSLSIDSKVNGEWCVRAYIAQPGAPMSDKPGCNACVVADMPIKPGTPGWCQKLSGDGRYQYSVFEGACPKQESTPNCKLPKIEYTDVFLKT